jgi:CelD/BcsL family acetyltransferase involved in cellulose biosynthesis
VELTTRDPLRLVRTPVEECDWDTLDAHPDRVIFQTREWLEFLSRAQRGEPVVAAVRDGDETLGWFTGLVVRRFGFRILGSPFAGWNSSYMGFTMLDESRRRDAWAALPTFAFRGLGCHLVEVRDRSTAFHALDGLGYEHGRTFNSYTLDLGPSEDEVFGGFTSACRRNVRKAEREGVVIEEANDLTFAAEYMGQLTEVFARQGLRPLYGADRVEHLVTTMLPTGRLLLLRARDPDGRCIATGIFPFMNGYMYFWGGASHRQYQHLRPNEALMWHAIRTAKAHGVETFDLCGGGDYKAKYGAERLPIAAFTRARWRPLVRARWVAEQVQRHRKGLPAARKPTSPVAAASRPD